MTYSPDCLGNRLEIGSDAWSVFGRNLMLVRVAHYEISGLELETRRMTSDGVPIPMQIVPAHFTDVMRRGLLELQPALPPCRPA